MHTLKEASAANTWLWAVNYATRINWGRWSVPSRYPVIMDNCAIAVPCGGMERDCQRTVTIIFHFRTWFNCFAKRSSVILLLFCHTHLAVPGMQFINGQCVWVCARVGEGNTYSGWMNNGHIIFMAEREGGIDWKQASDSATKVANMKICWTNIAL